MAHSVRPHSYIKVCIFLIHFLHLLTSFVLNTFQLTGMHHLPKQMDNFYTGKSDCILITKDSILLNDITKFSVIPLFGFCDCTFDYLTTASTNMIVFEFGMGFNVQQR